MDGDLNAYQIQHNIEHGNLQWWRKSQMISIEIMCVYICQSIEN